MDLRVGLSVGSLLDSLFFDLTTLGSATRANEPERQPGGRSLFELAAEDAVKQQQQQVERDEQDEEWRAHQKALYGE